MREIITKKKGVCALTVGVYAIMLVVNFAVCWKIMIFGGNYFTTKLNSFKKSQHQFKISNSMYL